jgi:hypothetical protein
MDLGLSVEQRKSAGGGSTTSVDFVAWVGRPQNRLIVGMFDHSVGASSPEILGGHGWTTTLRLGYLCHLNGHPSVKWFTLELKYEFIGTRRIRNVSSFMNMCRPTDKGAATDFCPNALCSGLEASQHDTWGSEQRECLWDRVLLSSASRNRFGWELACRVAVLM